MDDSDENTRYSNEKATAYHTETVVHPRDQVELERNFSLLALLGLAFTMFNSWNGCLGWPSVLTTALAASAAIVWGLIVSAVGTITIAISFAEMAHVFPLSGGQYDWTYIVAPTRAKNVLSFAVGWMSTAGWISLAASASAFVSNYIKGYILLFHPTFNVKSWHTFLFYLAATCTSTFVNMFGVRLLPHLDRFGGLWGGIGLTVISITLLACSSGKYQPAKSVFATFTNETGWPSGIAFILGLLQSMFGMTGFEAASHMVEEIPNPSITAPKVMIIGLAMGAGTAWIFMVILLFCLRSFDDVMVSPLGPVLEIYNQATGSAAGATCLCCINMMSSVFAGQGVTTIASRTLLAFARDRGMGQASPLLARIHPTFKAPAWSVAFVGLWIVVFGCIALGSSVALNAILSSAVVFLQLSYIIPVVCIIMRGESAFAGYTTQPKYSLGRFRLPVNLVALAFLLVTTVCFTFPPAIPVTSASMNYVVVVLGVVALMATVTWFGDARRRFHGPLDLEERLRIARSA